MGFAHTFFESEGVAGGHNPAPIFQPDDSLREVGKLVRSGRAGGAPAVGDAPE